MENIIVKMFLSKTSLAPIPYTTGNGMGDGGKPIHSHIGVCPSNNQT